MDNNRIKICKKIKLLYSRADDICVEAILQAVNQNGNALMCSRIDILVKEIPGVAQ
jgi:hypothetical protein